MQIFSDVPRESECSRNVSYYMCHVGIGDFIPRQGGNLKIVPKIGRNIGDTIKRWADGVEEDQGAWVNINWRREWRNIVKEAQG